MNTIWWTSLRRGARNALLAAASAVLLLLVASAWWLSRADHAVLFSDLRPQDAAVMTSELDKLKVPYALADNGATLLVEQSQVAAVRLRLMGKDLPLNGTVGFELFNHTDFGMTEFAQKINYQRALQGELTRTILSFPEIRDARVHLALPEQGLFKQNAARPKAAITLNLKEGKSLRPEQVTGVQRLVAAAVSGLTAQEVTIVDQHGVMLSRFRESDMDAGGSSERLDLKRETENYLARKAAAVLDKAFGPGQALASVDVILNMDHVRVTTEDVIAAPDARGGGTTGVLVRERESARDSATPDMRGPDGRGARGSSLQREVEYQAGRRVEQVVSHAGAIRRIQVAAVVRQPLEETQRDQLVRVLAAAVGASLERGDSVVVQSLQSGPPPEPTYVSRVDPVDPRASTNESLSDAVPMAAIGLLLAAAMLAWVRSQRKSALHCQPLTPAQRQAALTRVQQWLLQSNAAARVGDVPAKVESP